VAGAGNVCEVKEYEVSPRSSNRNTNPAAQAQMDSVVIIKAGEIARQIPGDV
jgi:hypothetical protein